MHRFILAIVLATIIGMPVIAETKGPSESSGAKTTAAQMKWETWTDDLFERAKKENRFVLLDLEAVWCHWCHVMDEKTYANADVARILNSNFIAVKVDQDSRPDLSNRYEEYGWPATIIFAPNGAELVKQSGYIPPEEMVTVLQDVIKNPGQAAVQPKKPVKFSIKGALTEPLRKELLSKHIDFYDTKLGSWGVGGQKYLDWDSVELAMSRGKADIKAASMAKQTLDAQLNLLDPIWGGVYQYSTHGDWKHPHFEKIMQMQGENLRIYSLGYNFYKDPKYLQAAKSIAAYLKNFLLSPKGAFYTSQDADVIRGKHSDWYFKLSDVERRSHGVPRVDQHIYSRENGWAITGLAHLYMATGDKQYLEQATRAADWIIANRSLPGGGFRHDEKDTAGPFLGDTLQMGRAFLALYEATADRQWLNRALSCVSFIEQHFQQESDPGLITAQSRAGAVHKFEPLLDENVMAARFANAIYHYTGNKDAKKMADSAMRFLATPEIARKRRYLVAGILLSDQELARDPIHITVIGSKQDPAAQALFAEAIRYPSTYKRVEWWDRREGPMLNSEVAYPELSKAAAFGCANQRCSLPIYKPEGIARTIDAFNKS